MNEIRTFFKTVKDKPVIIRKPNLLKEIFRIPDIKTSLYLLGL